MSMDTAALNAGRCQGLGTKWHCQPGRAASAKAFQKRNTVTTYLALSQAGLLSYEASWEGKVSFFFFSTLIQLKKYQENASIRESDDYNNTLKKVTLRVFFLQL